MRSGQHHLKQFAARSVAAALISMSPLLAGCDRIDLGPAVEGEVVRLAAPSLRYPKSRWWWAGKPDPGALVAPSRDEDFPVQATVAGDTRPILPLVWRAAEAAVAIDPASPAAKVYLPGVVFADADRVYATWSLADRDRGAEHGGGFFEVDHGEQTPSVTISFEARRPLEGMIYVYPLPSRSRLWHATRPVALGAGAALHFATGFLETDAALAGARFTISACTTWRCREIWSTESTPGAGPAGWQEHVLPLDELAGTAPAFLFEIDIDDDGEHPSSLPAFSHPTVRRPAPATAERPNIVLISVDTLRADHLSSYGYERETTPEIDRRLADAGTLFADCTSAAGSTLASHMTMFTGVEPSVHGSRESAAGGPSLPRLASYLRNSGYWTVGLAESGWMSATFGFDRGFDRYDEQFGASEGLYVPGAAAETLGEAERLLDELSDRRFFAFLHTYQVHEPYDPPEAFADFFAEPVAGDAEVLPAIAAARRAYDQEIRYTDSLVGRFLEALAARGLEENTVVVLTSDHGEEFGEHGHVSHGLHLYQEIVHVPLLVRGPGVAAGARIEDNVGLVDLAPTLLDIAGAPELAEASGRSLLPYLRGERLAGADERVFVSEHWGVFAKTVHGMQAGLKPPTWALRKGSRKMVSENGRLRGRRWDCYDLDADPQEKTMLADCAPLRTLLEEWPARAAARRKQLAAGNEAAPAGSTAEAAAVPPEIRQRLRELGYVE